jgi:transposase
MKPQKHWVSARDVFYLSVNIRNRHRLVHRLVAAAFGIKGEIIHHRDNDKGNCKPKNLKGATYSDNTRWAYEDGRIGSHWKLNIFQRKQVVRLYRKGIYHTKELASMFDVHRSSVLYLLREAGIKPHGMKVLTPAKVRRIRRAYKPGKVSMREVAEQFRVSEGTVANCVKKFK